ncbi:LOW QUALITY PROTEIN: 3-ketoacyl-CoA thiolase [Geomicrobium sp. JCM 19039]|nr:LOW QUALITY PROTEIN: 3-ketoacyl-CoA thiolase [Geomicrobium sp. JCM 19039]
MSEIVIVSAVRTAIGKKGGALSELEPAVYGGAVIQEALNRAKVEGEDVDDVIFGNCLSGGGNQARVSALEAGLPYTVPGLTIDRQCGSGINSVTLAAERIASGHGEIVVAGGTESMSLRPHLLSVHGREPTFFKPRLAPEQIGNPPMGITAENLALMYRISRAEQDEFAIRSQERMGEAQKKGCFNSQIIAIENFSVDEHPRPDVSPAKLSTLPSVFKKEGTVTAGNSSGVNDGASALVLMSGKEARRRGLKPMATVKNWAVAGVDPNIMGIGQCLLSKKCLKRSGKSLADMDLIECNEAFAAQTLAVDRELEFNHSKLNVNGGAIAHGHPIAATGGMLITKMIYELERREARQGLITACIGGGQGIALLVERQ